MIRYRKLAPHAALPARDAHVRSWAAMTSPNPSRSVEMGWGTLVMNPPSQPGEPIDFCFVFRPSLEARREAFVFAKAMSAELEKQFVALGLDVHLDFISAADHYHLLAADREVAQSRIAMNLLPAISHGAISGRGNQGRAVSATITGRHRAVEIEAED